MSRGMEWGTNWKRNRCLLSLSQSGLICVLWMKTVGVKVEWGSKRPAEGHPCGDLYYFIQSSIGIIDSGSGPAPTELGITEGANVV